MAQLHTTTTPCGTDAFGDGVIFFMYAPARSIMRATRVYILCVRREQDIKLWRLYHQQRRKEFAPQTIYNNIPLLSARALAANDVIIWLRHFYTRFLFTLSVCLVGFMCVCVCVHLCLSAALHHHTNHNASKSDTNIWAVNSIIATICLI